MERKASREAEQHRPPRRESDRRDGDERRHPGGAAADALRSLWDPPMAAARTVMADSGAARARESIYWDGSTFVDPTGANFRDVYHYQWEASTPKPKTVSLPVVLLSGPIASLDEFEDLCDRVRAQPDIEFRLAISQARVGRLVEGIRDTPESALPANLRAVTILQYFVRQREQDMSRVIYHALPRFLVGRIWQLHHGAAFLRYNPKIEAAPLFTAAAQTLRQLHPAPHLDAPCYYRFKFYDDSSPGVSAEERLACALSATLEEAQHSPTHSSHDLVLARPETRLLSASAGWRGGDRRSHFSREVPRRDSPFALPISLESESHRRLRLREIKSLRGTGDQDLNNAAFGNVFSLRRLSRFLVTSGLAVDHAEWLACFGPLGRTNGGEGTVWLSAAECELRRRGLQDYLAGRFVSREAKALRLLDMLNEHNGEPADFCQAVCKMLRTTEPHFEVPTGIDSLTRIAAMRGLATAQLPLAEIEAAAAIAGISPDPVGAACGPAAAAAPLAMDYPIPSAPPAMPVSGSAPDHATSAVASAAVFAAAAPADTTQADAAFAHFRGIRAFPWTDEAAVFGARARFLPQEAGRGIGWDGRLGRGLTVGRTAAFVYHHFRGPACDAGRRGPLVLVPHITYDGGPAAYTSVVRHVENDLAMLEKSDDLPRESSIAFCLLYNHGPEARGAVDEAFFETQKKELAAAQSVWPVRYPRAYASLGPIVIARAVFGPPHDSREPAGVKRIPVPFGLLRELSLECLREVQPESSRRPAVVMVSDSDTRRSANVVASAARRLLEDGRDNTVGFYDTRTIFHSSNLQTSNERAVALGVTRGFALRGFGNWICQAKKLTGERDVPLHPVEPAMTVPFPKGFRDGQFMTAAGGNEAIGVVGRQRPVWQVPPKEGVVFTDGTRFFHDEMRRCIPGNLAVRAAAVAAKQGCPNADVTRAWHERRDLIIYMRALESQAHLVPYKLGRTITGIFHVTQTVAFLLAELLTVSQRLEMNESLESVLENHRKLATAINLYCDRLPADGTVSEFLSNLSTIEQQRGDAERAEARLRAALRVIVLFLSKLDHDALRPPSALLQSAEPPWAESELQSPLSTAGGEASVCMILPSLQAKCRALVKAAPAAEQAFWGETEADAADVADAVAAFNVRMLEAGRPPARTANERKPAASQSAARPSLPAATTRAPANASTSRLAAAATGIAAATTQLAPAPALLSVAAAAPAPSEATALFTRTVVSPAQGPALAQAVPKRRRHLKRPKSDSSEESTVDCRWAMPALSVAARESIFQKLAVLEGVIASEARQLALGLPDASIATALASLDAGLWPHFEAASLALKPLVVRGEDERQQNMLALVRTQRSKVGTPP